MGIPPPEDLIIIIIIIFVTLAWSRDRARGHRVQGAYHPYHNPKQPAEEGEKQKHLHERKGTYDTKAPWQIQWATGDVLRSKQFPRTTGTNLRINLLSGVLKELICRACVRITEQRQIERSKKDKENKKRTSRGNDEGNQELWSPLSSGPIALSQLHNRQGVSSLHTT